MAPRLPRLNIVLFVLMTVGTTVSASAEIPWQRSPEAVLQSARQTGKPILVFVTTDWCHYCKKMKRETWADPRVDATVSRDFETLVLDGDRDKQIVKKLDVQGYPATLLYSPNGEFISQQGGFMAPAKTLQWLASHRPTQRR